MLHSHLNIVFLVGSNGQPSKWNNGILHSVFTLTKKKQIRMLKDWEIELLQLGYHQHKMVFMHSVHIHTRDLMEQENQILLRLYHKNNNKQIGISSSIHTIVILRKPRVMCNSKIERKQFYLNKLITSLYHKFTSILVKIVSIHHGVDILENSE